ncbi:glycoside hydrolase family 16 protein [Psychroflexus montanilacus]|uniref:glycoside hydrolase family 16 protein n=1 Tax=Psychroflexus montanilacus TaxID=2873598 RepID=UPI001CCB0E3D|nr:glycoside hydrolase family 16 protein [Psychroflexus montanilacus]MBZ9651696.1 glycoside hydrolase family 16 protein [Psychroflexus montanilacus]
MKNNKIKFSILILCIAIFSFQSCDLDETQTVTTLNNLVMEEEFDGNELNSELWSFELGDGSGEGLPGWGNNELQNYTDREENLKVEGGILKISARQENFEGSDYTSARIITKAKFEKQYGRIEARMKMPWGTGIWPAFWMLGANIDEVGWPQTGEIDIMEYDGGEPSVVHGSVHGPGYSGGNAVTKSYEFLDDRLDTDFHVYGIEWGENYINYYVDDILYNQITPESEDLTGEWVFNKPFYIIINMAVGGSFVGPPDSSTVFPQTLEVDYVRVYD